MVQQPRHAAKSAWCFFSFMQLNGEQNCIILITSILVPDFAGIKELIIFWTGNARTPPTRKARGQSFCTHLDLLH